MKDAPVVLGINRMQDASVCLMQGARLLWAIQKERLTRRPHAHGAPGDFRDVYGPRLPWPAQPVDVVVECDTLDADAAALAANADELRQSLRLAPACRRARLSRHLAHLYSAFHPSPLRDAAVLVIDAEGSPVASLSEYWGGAAHVPGDWREVASFYHADRERVLCIGKQVWNRDAAHPVGLGMFHALLTQAIFPGEGMEDKLMALAQHGDPQALSLPPLEVDAGQVAIPAAWLALLQDGARFHYGQPGVDAAACAHLAAAGQRAFEDALLGVARWLHAQTRSPRLCYAGAAARNGAANARLLRETPFSEVFIPPAPGSAGTALGAAVYGLVALCHGGAAFRWTHDDLGPTPCRQDIEAALADGGDLHVDYLPGVDALSSRMLDLLQGGRVLAVYQGGSEFGPHALGRRSILADARRSAARNWIDARIRQDDGAQPLAPIVLEERAGTYFDLPGPSPFLGLAAPVQPQMADRVAAICRHDGQVPLQTVGPDDNPLLRRLLSGAEARTGVPVLLATALCGKDEPIVETPAEAVAAFRRMPLHALAMPPFLVTKRIEPELPA